MAIMQRFLLCTTCCLVTLALAGCAEFDRKFDIAMFGSEEEAKIAKKEMEEQSAEREILNLRKMEKKTFELINEKREQQRISTIGMDEKLQLYARIRAKEISEGFEFSRPDGTEIGNEFRLTGLSKPESVVYTWMTDIDTRKNLLGRDLTTFAIGICKKGASYYWVLVTND